jgi:hypothetical protein
MEFQPRQRLVEVMVAVIQGRMPVAFPAGVEPVRVVERTGGPLQPVNDVVE